MREIQRLPENLGQAKDGETTLELRFVNTKGETEVWMLKTNDPNNFLILASTAAPVWRAYIDDLTDARLTIQRASIDRLHRHVLFHHDDLGIVNNCTFQEGNTNA